MKKRCSVVFLTVFSAAAPAAADRMLIRTYETGVPLIADGRAACVIVYPAGPGGWRELAQQIAAAIVKLGVPQVPIVPDTEAVAERLGPLRSDLKDKSLVLLGDLNSNRAVFGLYANYYTYCDAKYPGGYGFALHTIVRPLGRDVNHLMIGGSTEAGVAAGVERLLARLEQLKAGPNVALPYCLNVKLGPEWTRIIDPFLDAARRGTDSPPPADKGRYVHARDQFTQNAHLYFYTGHSLFADRARQWVLYLADYDPRAIRIDDYKLENLAAAWRRVSPSPVFTPAERQMIDTRMYETAEEMDKAWWRLKDASPGIGGRHHTTGMLAWWTLIRVLLELGEPGDSARQQLTQWRGEAEAYLDGLLRHYWDDLDDYQSADSVQNTASYCLQTGQLSWYEDGLARRAAQRLLSVTDNLGWYAGIGSYGEALPGWERFTLNGGLLLGSCAFVYQDGSFHWILTHFPSLDRSWGTLQPWRLHQYAVGDRLKPEQPSWLEGAGVVRVTPYRLNHINSGEFLKTRLMDDFRVAGLKARPVSERHAFDKLVIRSRPQPSSSYLLLQGMSAITLSTIDMNAIIRYTDQGRLWLLHNTRRQSLFFKNAVYVSNGTNEQPLPAACELVAHGDFAEASLAASRLPDYRGTTWTRNLIVLPDRFTVVIDHVRADNPGQYRVYCTWRTPGFATLTGSRWESDQEDVTFTLCAAEAVGLTSRRLPRRDGATRPTVLRQSRTFAARADDDLFFENVLYTSGPSRRQAYEIRRLQPGVIAIRQRGTGGNSVYVAAASDRGIAFDGMKTGAAAIVLGPEGAWMAGGTTLSLGGMEFSGSPAGRISPGKAFTEKAAPLLTQWWEAAQPIAEDPIPTTPVTPSAGPTPRWTHAGPSARGALIDGVRLTGVRNVTGPTLPATDWILPVLRAEPRLSPRPAGGFHLDPAKAGATGQHAAQHPAQTAAETMLSPLTGAEFMLELPRPSRIDEIAIFGDTFGETAAPLPAAQLDLELILSTDGFNEDKRTRRVNLNRETTYHNLYKGHAYVFERYRLTGLNEVASAVRVRVLDGPGPEMILTDVQLRSAGPAETKLAKVRIVDLDGDGKDEILCWTTEGELAVVDADGTERWRKNWPAGIIAVDAWDLNNDKTREVFISLADRHVAVLNPDGSPRWEKDLSDMYRQTDERFFGDGSVVYGLAAWQPKEAKAKEILFTSSFYAARLDAGGEVKGCFKRSGHFTHARAVPSGFARGGDLVMRSDIPWVGPVPLEWWRASTGEVDVVCSVPNGRAVFFEVDDYDGDGNVEALVATEQGIGLYSPTDPKTRWQHMTEAPPAGVGVIAQPGKAPATVIYGREDGYLFVMQADGTLVDSTILDEPIRCLTALRTRANDPVILVGTDTSLLCLRLDDLAAVWQRPGSYQRLELLRAAGGRRVLAITRGGQLEALD